MSSSDKVNRREFLTLNFSSAIEFLGNIIAPSLEKDRDFIRPPGASDELSFLMSCTRCGICKDVCPVNTIELFSPNHGAEITNTPYLDPNEIPCTFCNKCIDHCPTDALSHDEKPVIGTAKIYENNCLAHRDIMCDYCVRTCPVEEALTLVNGKPIVDEDLCNGCGKCVSSCIQTHKGIYVEAIS